VEGGRQPRKGLLFEQKNKLQQEVRRRVHYYAVMTERRRVQRREMMFCNHDNSMFKIPGKQRSHCSKLRVGGKIVLDPDEMLGAWSSHFKRFSGSSRNSPGLSELEEKVEEMAAKSHANEEGILDCSFTREEVAGTMMKLELRKAAGPDGVVGEHLKWGGHMVQEWLLRVTNAVVDLEVLPSILKSGVIVPRDSGHFVLTRFLPFRLLVNGSMPPTKVCPQCKAAAPVRRKTSERSDHVFRSKRKAECNLREKALKRMRAVELDSVKSARKAEDKLYKACERVSETRE